MISVTSKVAQKVYVSAYIYNDQHYSNGGCSQERRDNDNSSMWLYNAEFGGWNGFKYSAFHSEGIDMYAGQTLVMEMEVTFGEEDMLPSDYSVVAWAEKQEVQMTSTGDDQDTTFPNFELDETIQQYNWNGEPIGEGDAQEETKDDDQEETKDDDQEESKDDEQEETKDDAIPAVPYYFETSNEKLEHNFSFESGTVYCTTEVLQSDKFQQECSITLNDSTYYFKNVV